jgi:hypothetical protein
VSCAVWGFGSGAGAKRARGLQVLRLWRVWLAGGEGGRRVAWGVVLGRGFCAAVRCIWHDHNLSVGGSVVVGEYGVREVIMFLLKSLGGVQREEADEAGLLGTV